jgi:hypothetical protein
MLIHPAVIIGHARPAVNKIEDKPNNNDHKKDRHQIDRMPNDFKIDDACH